MGLDAFVYCDCFERNNLRCNPPAEAKVLVSPNGSLTCESDDEEVWLGFNLWRRTRACLHAEMILTHRALGSADVIDQLRAEVEKEQERFPLLLHRVLYSSTHTCDWINVEELGSLSEEVKHLSELRRNGSTSDALHHFQIQMAELIIAAQSAGKPICF